MENHIPVARFGPSRGLSESFLVGALLLGLLAAFDDDRSGRFLVGAASLVLLSVGLYDSLVTPRLIASPVGLEVRTAGLRAQVPWADVHDLRLDERSRLGLSSRTIEIDTGSALVVLGRHSLGREPREVFDLVSAFRPT